MTFTIQIKGTEEVRKFLENANKETLIKANQAIIKAGFYVQAEVKSSIAGQRAEPVSVDTGRFLNSVKMVQNALLTASVETNVEYAKHLEYGTSKMRPRSHFRNTATRNQDKVREFVANEVKKIS